MIAEDFLGPSGGAVSGTSLPRWSGLGRSIDPSLRNHQLMLALGALAGAVGSGYSWFAEGQVVMVGLLEGFGVGLGAGLAWVLGRELDPDNPPSAFLGMLFLVPSALALGPPDLLLAFWSVFLLRAINRTTGLPAMPLDDALLLGVSLWLSFRLHPILLLATGAFLMVDAVLEPGHSRHLVLGGALAIVGLAWVLVSPSGITPRAELAALLPLAVGASFYLVLVLTLPQVSARGDLTDEPLSRTRVLVSQVAAPAQVALVVLLIGAEGVGRSLSLWSALIGVAGFHLSARGLRALRKS